MVECTYVAQDQGEVISMLDIENQIVNKSFELYGQQNFELKEHQYYWGKVQLQNNLTDATNLSEWVLYFSHTLTEIDLFVEQPDGGFHHVLNGFYRNPNEKAFSPRVEGNFCKVILPPQQPITVYFRAKGSRNKVSPNFTIDLRHIDVLYHRLQVKSSAQFLFIGFIAMMLFYNLFLYFLRRDLSFIYYSGYLFFLILYTSNISGELGTLLVYIIPNHLEYTYVANFGIILGFMCYIAFFRSFLNLKNLLPKWDLFFHRLFLIGIPILMVQAVVMFTSNFSFAQTDIFSLVYIVLFLPTTIVFIYHLYKTGDKKGRFIVLGMVFWLIGIAANSIMWANVSSFNVLDMFFLKVGSVLEIMIFSLGLAYRERETYAAKEQAQFELEKSEMIKKQEAAEKKRLKKMDVLKSRLYTNITHEFRTPLTVIMGINENIQGHLQEKKLIRRNSKNLLRLINQLLDLSKLESAELQINKTPGDIATYLQYLTESFYSMAVDKGVRLVYFTEEESVKVLFDEEKIQHIIYNLLSNALKFTEETGQVVVNLKKETLQEKEFLKILVKDNGIGISEDVQPHIFDRFYQVDNSSSRKGEGTGIGLSLVKELVDLLKGKIEVSSTVGKGTTFTVWLPFDPITEEVPLRDYTHLQAANKKQKTLVDQAALLQKKSEGIQTSEEENLPILLLIEDNQDVVLYIQSILEKSYTIHSTKNGQLGIEQAFQLIPDIIISDVMMPIMDGNEVCQTLKKDERTSHIPIILLTAKNTQADKLKGLKFGADDYLTKPFYREELLLRLDNLITNRLLMQKKYANSLDLPSPIVERSIDDQFLQKLKEIVEKRFDQPTFNVAELAQALLMDRSQVYRKVKALTGKSVAHYIRSARLQKGLDLLRYSKMNISEIAYEIGYTDPSYFTRTFQKEYGMLPSAFRS